jgi:sugar O-acyltransferase (sialic acid O-acetyltransferase NeuD family)
MKQKIIILGGKGTAVNIAEGIWDAEHNFGMKVECLGFAFDDDSFGNEINGFPILCKTNEVFMKFGKMNDVKFLFQMNNPNKMIERSQLIKSYSIPDNKWANFIHPSAFVSKSVKMGVGNVVFVNCAIHSNAIIGNHCTILAQTTIGHDTVLNDSVFMATHVCIGSNVYLKSNIFMGQNSAVRDKISICENTIIGLGSSVVTNIEEPNMIYLGNPSKPHKNIINKI